MNSRTHHHLLKVLRLVCYHTYFSTDSKPECGCNDRIQFICCGPGAPVVAHSTGKFVAGAPVKSVEEPNSKPALSIASSSPKNDAQIPPWPPWCHGTPRDFGEPGIPLPHTKVDTPAPGSPVASVHQWNLRSPVQDRKLWRRKRIMGKQRMLCFGSSSS